MVQRVITGRFDDFDGSPASATERFGYKGRQFEIDLSEEHAQELDQLLSLHVGHV